MTTESSLTASAARGGTVMLFAQVARVAVMLLQVIVLARLITPGDFGLLAMVVALTGVAVILRDFGLSTSALRSPSLTSQQRSNLFWLNTAAGFSLALVIYILSWPIAAFYRQPDLVLIVQWIAPTYLLSGISAQFRVAINQALRFRALAICDVVPPITALIAAVTVALTGHGLAALVALQVAAPATDVLLSALLARWRPGLPRKTSGMRGLLTFGVGFAGTQLLGYISRNVDSIALGRVWGAASLGLYDRAFQLSAGPVNQINAPMTKVAVPVLSRVAEDQSRFVRGLNSAQLVACYGTSTVLLTAAGLASPLIALFLGPEWAEAAPIFALLAIGSVFRAIQQIAIWMQVTKGAAHSLFISYLIGQPLIIIAILCGLPWGPIGVATGSAIGYAVFWVFSMLWAGRNTGVNVRPLLVRAVRVIVFFGAPAGLAAFLVTYLAPTSVLVQLLLGTLAAVLALVLSWLLSTQTRLEISMLRRFIRTGLGRNN